jgi:hypothetical protein
VLQPQIRAGLQTAAIFIAVGLGALAVATFLGALAIVDYLDRVFA